MVRGRNNGCSSGDIIIKNHEKIISQNGEAVGSCPVENGYFGTNSTEEDEEDAVSVSRTTNQKKRRKNQRLTTEQQSTLLETFVYNTHPTGQDQERLAKQLGLTSNTVKFWFQNQRNKDKAVKTQKVNETLQAENERLQMRLQQLETVINSCPSCSNHLMHNGEVDIPHNIVVTQPSNRTLVPCPTLSNEFHQPPLLQNNNLNMANGIIQVAFDEIIRIASISNMWVDATTTVVREVYDQKFNLPPQPGMRVETDLESAIVPLAPSDLVQLMMNVDKWASTLFPIVYRGSSGALAAEWKNLSQTCTNIQELQKIDAEFQLPTPRVETRKFSFLRYKRKIADGWAIVDISEDYLHLDATSLSWLTKMKCLRRPSGLIIKQLDKDCSQVVWIENVEVFQCKSESIYNQLVISHLPFGAKRWISTLLQQLKRNDSEFVLGSHFCQEARQDLLRLGKAMVMDYLESVNGGPDQKTWRVISHKRDKPFRIMEKDTLNHSSVSNNVVSVSHSFHLPIKPRIFVDYITNKNSKAQWRSELGWTVGEELILLATNDRTSCILLYKTADGYLFQETMSDEFLSFVISAPMTEEEISAVLSGKWRDVSLQPSGFAVMPDGSGGLESGGSLVTLSLTVSTDLSCTSSDLSCTSLRNSMTTVIGELSEDFQISRRD